MNKEIYIGLLDKIDSYDNYKNYIKQINFENKIEHTLLPRFKSFIMRSYLFQVKISIALFVTFIFFVTLGKLAVYLDKKVFHFGFTKEVLNNILNSTDPIFLLAVALMLFTLTKVFLIRKEYYIIKISLYIAIMTIICWLFYNEQVIYIPLALFNIYIFIKYKSSFFLLKSIQIVTTKDFICKNKLFFSNLVFRDKEKKYFEGWKNWEDTYDTKVLFGFILLFLIGGIIMNITIELNILGIVQYISIVSTLYFSILSMILSMNFLGIAYEINSITLQCKEEKDIANESFN